jgi:hypothetical protein
MSDRDFDLARLTELSVDELLGASTEDEAAELQRLRLRFPEFDFGSLERAAAALHLASLPASEAMPERLNIQIATDASEFFRSQESLVPLVPPTLVPPPDPVPASRAWIQYGGWLTAAAILVASVLTRHHAAIPVTQSPAPVVAEEPRSPFNEPTPAPVTLPATRPETVPEPALTPEPQTDEDPSTARAQLLASHRPLVQRAWRPGTDATGTLVKGDVVWDPRSQTGYMRFVGLSQNNPNVEQYQLWIFDASRDPRFPVDGGVFNAVPTAKGEFVIPIRAHLPVDVATMFVVTVERPGGVVVSDRSRIAAVANVT